MAYIATQANTTILLEVERRALVSLRGPINITEDAKYVMENAYMTDIVMIISRECPPVAWSLQVKGIRNSDTHRRG